MRIEKDYGPIEIPKKLKSQAQKLYKTGLKHFKKNNYNDALKCYFEALQITPFDDDIRNGFLIILELLEKTEMFDKLVEKLVEGEIEDAEQLFQDLIY